MKCKNCGCDLSPKEKAEIEELRVAGLKAELLCDDCYNEQEINIGLPPEDTFDSDSGL